MNQSIYSEHSSELQMNDQFDPNKLAHVTSILKVLSNPDRLKILCTLLADELNVQQIELATHIEQPTMSQQLTVLRKANLVSTRRSGKQIFYRMHDPKILQLIQTLEHLYCHNEIKKGNSFIE